MRQLIHHELLHFAEAHVDPLDPEWRVRHDETIGDHPTELDVRLGRVVYHEQSDRSTEVQHRANPNNWSKLWSQNILGPKESLTIEPGQFVLVETWEHLTLPAHVKGVFTIRSWAAKSGLDQSVSITLKPNWSGNLVMELRNNLQKTSLQFKPGQAIGQIEFYELFTP